MALRIIGIVIVMLVLFFPVFALVGVISFGQMKDYMLVGSILWFGLAPFWIKNDK